MSELFNNTTTVSTSTTSTPTLYKTVKFVIEGLEENDFNPLNEKLSIAKGTEIIDKRLIPIVLKTTRMVFETIPGIAVNRIIAKERESLAYIPELNVAMIDVDVEVNKDISTDEIVRVIPSVENLFARPVVAIWMDKVKWTTPDFTEPEDDTPEWTLWCRDDEKRPGFRTSAYKRTQSVNRFRPTKESLSFSKDYIYKGEYRFEKKNESQTQPRQKQSFDKADIRFDKKNFSRRNVSR